MNRIVAVPNWSFYAPSLAGRAKELLGSLGMRVHYCQGDIDHQRTVTAFSGLQAEVFVAARELARLLLPEIDLQLQHGVHPRVGALDVMPFVLLEGSEPALIASCREWAANYSSEFGVPVYLYEKAAFERREARLPALRGQLGPISQPYDFGTFAHPRWGASVVGVRDFLVAANIDLATCDLSIARGVAKAIRLAREEGHPSFVGVRALGFELPSRGTTQLSLNFTQPDRATFDGVFEFAAEWLADHDVAIEDTELIGVIRRRDVPGATHLFIDPTQIVD